MSKDIHNTSHRHRFNIPLTLQVLLLMSAATALFLPSIRILFPHWIQWDEDLAHALPTIGIFIFLIARTHEFPYRTNTTAIQWLLLMLLGSLSLTWFLLITVNIAALANLIVFLSIPMLIAASFSIKTARFFAAAIGILFFTLPVFSQFNNFLVDISAAVVGQLVHLIGITALIDGQSIYLPSGHIFIAGGCSGLRYLTIALLMGYLLSILNHYSLKRSLLCLAIAVLLGLSTNWLRIFLLVVIGNITAMQSSLMHDHELFGWILFSGILFPSIYFAPILKEHTRPVSDKPRFKPIAPIIVLAIGPSLLFFSHNGSLPAPELSLSKLEISPSDNSQRQLNLTFPDKAKLEQQSFELDDVLIQANIAQYLQKDKKEKLVPYFEIIFNTEEWLKFNSPESAALASANIKAIILKRSNSIDYQLLLYRYEVGKYNTSNYEMAKLLQVPATFLGYRYFNIFTLSTACQDYSCAKEFTVAEKIALLWDEKTKTAR